MQLQDNTDKWNEDSYGGKNWESGSEAYEKGYKDGNPYIEKGDDRGWYRDQSEGFNKSDDNTTKWISKPQIEDSGGDNEE